MIHNFSSLGYGFVLLVSCVESFALVGDLFPGAALVVLMGFLSAQGYFDPWSLLFFASAGALFGDLISYWFASSGRRFLSKENKILKPDRLEEGERFFQKHGSKSVFLGRFIGSIRPIAPFIAGLEGQDKRTFLLWNITSAILWSIVHVGLGFLSGVVTKEIGVWSTRTSLPLFSIFIWLAIILYIVKKSKPLFHFFHSILISVKKALVKNPDVQASIRNHPLVFRLLKRRLERSAFSGLSLTLLTASFIYVIFLFFGVVQHAIETDQVGATDIRLANFFFELRDPKLVSFFLWVTLLGKWQMVTSIAAVVSVFCIVRRRWMYVPALWLTLLGAALMNVWGKVLFERPRPSVAYYIERSFSFPSGHATIAVALFGFLAYILLRETKRWRHKVPIFFGAALAILLIGLSRLYLGVHFFSDVWGGYLLGALWLIIGMGVSEWLIRRKVAILSVSFPLKIRAIPVVLLVLEVFFYVAMGVRYAPPLADARVIRKEVVVVDDVLGAFAGGGLPRYSEMLRGGHQAPLSFIILARDMNDFVDAMGLAGWYLADAPNLETTKRLAKAAVLDESYPTAPMTPSFWNAETHDLGFQKPTDSGSVRSRHHARFWDAGILTRDGYRVYVGTASLDIGIKWGVTHEISPDIDTEREYILKDLEGTGRVSTYEKTQFVNPVIGKNFGGDPFFTDGELYMISLRS